MRNEQAFNFPNHPSRLLWRKMQAKLEVKMPNILIEGYEHYILIRKPRELARVIVFTASDCDYLTVRITQDLNKKVSAYNGVDYALNKHSIDMLCEIIPVIMGIATPAKPAKKQDKAEDAE